MRGEGQGAFYRAPESDEGPYNVLIQDCLTEHIVPYTNPNCFSAE
jgi:hypothetical protein